MTLAIALSVFGWIALGSRTIADEAPSWRIPPSQKPEAEISAVTSSRPTYVALASGEKVAEIASPTDIMSNQSLAGVSHGYTSTPISLSQGQDASGFAGLRQPLPFGPSAVPALLHYMTCDPHSCPNIWQGYETQRTAELAKKCTPPGSGCGCGSCSGRSNLYSSACLTCSSPLVQKPVNRYRSTSPSGCASCGKTSCDGLNGDQGCANGCASCQTSSRSAATEQLSEAPTPAIAR